METGLIFWVGSRDPLKSCFFPYKEVTGLVWLQHGVNAVEGDSE